MYQSRGVGDPIPQSAEIWQWQPASAIRIIVEARYRTLRQVKRILRSRFHWVAVLVSLAGVVVCAAALLGFVATMATNNLPWYPGLTVQEHYQEIGRSYSQGFIIGFFLCFFLVMGSVSLATWFQGRRRKAAASPSSDLALARQQVD